MVPVEDNSPVLIGNKVESIVPYHMSDEFVVDAKEDGEVVEVTDDWVVVRYKSGKNYAIDISNRVQKNSAGGFYIENKLTCDLKVGDKFKKGNILAYNKLAFNRNANDKGVSMNLGVLCKIAIMSNWDVYEDSVPITASLANRMATTMVWDKKVSLDALTYVDYIAKVGDQVKTGDPIIKFRQVEEEDVANLFKGLREDFQEEIISDISTVIKSKYTGEVVDIRIYSTVPLDAMDESMAKIIKEYQKRIHKKNAVLDKYKNEGDYNYYKAGQVISETAEIMKPGSKGKIAGEYAENKIIIQFFVKYRDIAAKGDKLCAEFALKGVTSHVIEEGYEPYSEYRPDEEISTIVAPLAVAARKVPSVFLAMFGNKLLIELKRQLKDMYL